MWIARNLLIFKNTSQTPEELIGKAIRKAKSWHVAQESLIKKREAVSIYQANHMQPDGRLRFIDAAWDKDIAQAGLGWHLTYEAEDTVEEHSEFLPNVHSALSAESWAIIKASMKAREKKSGELTRIF